MKHFIKIFAVLTFILALFSCRDANDIPEDIHEHEEIEKLVVTLTNTADPTDIQTINYIGGVADHAMTLVPGTTYNVDLDFMVKHDDHYHSVADELEEEKDEHFITFQFANTDLELVRRADDIVRTDGNKLGLKTQWTINQVATNAQCNIKLVHAATNVSDHVPSAQLQLGSTTGGSADVNAFIAIQ